MSGRKRLPNRREIVTTEIEAGGIRAHASIGFGPDRRPAEIFLRPKSGRVGSDVDFLVDDVAIVISVALQHGITPEVLGRSLGYHPGGEPASVIGAAIALIAEHQPPKRRDDDA